MITIDYITNDLETLKLNDSVSKIKNSFKSMTFTHIPVVEDKQLLGLISETDMQGLDVYNNNINSLRYLFESFFVEQDANLLMVLKEFAKNEANILPVLNEKKEYIGYLELSDILHFFNNTPFLKEEGTIIIVSKNKKEYSFSQVAQIVESNDAELFGAFVSKRNSDFIEITLKTSTTNINSIIQTFRRYDYTIELGLHEDNYLNELKERSEYLQKYLNI